jgi:hypothetical protein
MRAKDKLSAHLENRLIDLEKARKAGSKVIGYTPGGFLPRNGV